MNVSYQIYEVIAQQWQACRQGYVKLADADGFASVTPERAHVWMIQTPQGFTYPLIRAAYDKMMSREEYQQGVTMMRWWSRR